MSEGDYERELGGIHEQLASIIKGQADQASETKEMRKDLQAVNLQVGALQSQVVVLADNGCARGKEQDAAIKEHKATLEKQGEDIKALRKTSGKEDHSSEKSLNLGPLKLRNYGGKDVMGIVTALGVLILLWKLVLPNVGLPLGSTDAPVNSAQHQAQVP